MKHEIHGVLPNQLNAKRRTVILFERSIAHQKLEAHVRPTIDRTTGFPDGGTESAVTKLGVCLMCGLTRDDILNCTRGGTCNKELAKLGLPFCDLDGYDGAGDPLDGIF